MVNSKPKGQEKFSFGVREMRQARLAEPLALQSGPLQMLDEDRGSDPYNTSGSFDRKKNWSRVGKR
jgi:hypothetical protein